MDSLLMNKIFGGILGAWLFMLVLSYVVGPTIYAAHGPGEDERAYEIEVTEGESGAGAEEEVDFALLLATADLAKGERVSKKCLQCHTFEKGGKNGTGPNLWDVVGRQRGTIAGFNYSSSLPGSGDSWDYEALSSFLENPRGYISGTTMSFAGLRKAEDRANMIAFLRTQSDAPKPLPAPSAPPAVVADDQAAAPAAPAAPVAPEAPEAVAPAEEPTPVENEPAPNQ